MTNSHRPAVRVKEAAEQILREHGITEQQLMASMSGYAEGRWSKDRVCRELGLSDDEFWFVKASLGITPGDCPAPHYWT